MEADSFIARFGEAIEKRRATVLVGAGMSRGAGYPNWNELLAPLRSRYLISAEWDIDLSMAAQFIENQPNGREQLIEHVCSVIGKIEPTPTLNHRLLARLPLPEVWTTNYDSLIESAEVDAEVVAVDEEFLTSDASILRVYKMHGSIPYEASSPVGDISRLVISKNDYDHYDVRHPRTWRLLQAQILTKSFLFLGFSFSDPNFEAALKIVRLFTPDEMMDHYAIVRREQDDSGLFDMQAEELERSGVHVVEIGGHEEITDLLRRLVARTRPMRLLVSGSQTQSTQKGSEAGPLLSYPVAPEIDEKLLEIARVIGVELSKIGISVTTASMVGATVGYALLDALGDDYDASRMMLVRRHKDEPVDPPNSRSGMITFTGEDPGTLRDKVFDQVRAVLVLAGGEGTRQEVDKARARGMGVVPLACTGGTARDVWTEMISELGKYDLGERAVDYTTFEALNSENATEAVAAAVALVSRAMFLAT